MTSRSTHRVLSCFYQILGVSLENFEKENWSMSENKKDFKFWKSVVCLALVVAWLIFKSVIRTPTIDYFTTRNYTNANGNACVVVIGKKDAFLFSHLGFIQMLRFMVKQPILQ